MAYNPNVPAPDNLVQDDIVAMRENFQHLDPLAQAVGELQTVSGLAPITDDLQTVSGLAPITDDLQTVSGLAPVANDLQTVSGLAPVAGELQAVSELAPYVQTILDSRIVEMGSNANGEYVRWENGLQVCTAKVEVDFTSTGFKNFPYPAEFFDSPWGGSFAAAPGSFPTADDPRKFTMSTLRLGTNAWEFRVNEVFSETNRPTRFFAIGRWK